MKKKRTMFNLIKMYFSDQQDCKWDVLDTNHTVLTGVHAIFRNESRLAEIIGDISLEKLYILKGKVYISGQYYSLYLVPLINFWIVSGKVI